MVGLVIVSHSRKLALAIAELVKSLTTDTLPIAVAGGVGDDYAELGTDATDIMEAIEKVHSDEGTLILVDMGSALLSTELALEFLGEDIAKNIKVTSAPVLEGAVSAGVQIQLNSPLEKVYSEAMAGLQAKQIHLDENVEDTALANNDTVDLAKNANTLSKQFIIENPHGLHVRPVTQLIQTIAPFTSKIGIQNSSKQSEIVDGRSAISVSCLQLLKGDSMTVFALGDDATETLNAITDLHNAHYGENLEEKINIETTKEKASIIAISEGYALAPAFTLDEKPFVIKSRNIDDVSAECEKLKIAIKQTIEQLQKQAKKLTKTESDIITTHAIMLDDPSLLEKAQKHICDKKCNAEYAWNETIQSIADDYRQMENTYFQQRATDIIDIGKQVLSNLGIKTDTKITLDKPVILFLSELSPSQASELNSTMVKGIVTKYGGATSHSAIIARSLGIPMISGFNIDKVQQGNFCILDGYKNQIYCNPNQQLTDSYQAKYDEWQAQRKELQQLAQQIVQTKDGIQISVLANVASLQEAQAVTNNGADGVGLLRTEFLFLDNADAPSEESQYQQLRAMLTAVGKPVTIRTFDIGGDKQVPYVNQNEENPFLGVRGVRLYQQQPQLFTDHIRAILRASVGQEVKIMFPMIATLDDFVQTKKWVENIHNELTEKGIEHQWPLPIGMMVETPASVLLADEFAKVADFFSIGTNDLTQYIMAADRGSVELAKYNNPLSSPVLDMIKTVIQAGENENIPVSLCGNTGKLTKALPILINLGLRTVSLSLSSVAEAKQIIATLDNA